MCRSFLPLAPAGAVAELDLVRRNRMAEVVAGLAWYRREDYPKLLAIFDDADSLPETYEEWLEKAMEIERELIIQGHRVVRATIDPAIFPSWCAAKHLKLDASARTRFATEEAEASWQRREAQ